MMYMMKRKLLTIVCFIFILTSMNIVNANTFVKKQTGSPDIEIEYMLSWYDSVSGYRYVFLCLENVGDATLSYSRFTIRFWVNDGELLNVSTQVQQDWDPGERVTGWAKLDRGTAKCDEMRAKIDEEDIPEDTNKQNDEETCEITYASRLMIVTHKSNALEASIDGARIECKIKKENDQEYEIFNIDYTNSNGELSFSVPPHHKFSITAEHNRYKFETKSAGPISPGYDELVDFGGRIKSKNYRPVFLELLEQLLLRLRSL